MTGTHSDRGAILGGHRRVGLYQVVQVFRVGDRVYFEFGGAGWFEDAGFVCLPEGDRAATANSTPGYNDMQYQHLSGCWYQWSGDLDGP